MPKQPLAASRRRLGIRARVGYLIGAVLAGLWVAFYMPRLYWGHHYGTQRASESTMPADFSGALHGNDELILFASVLCFAVYHLTGHRISPLFSRAGRWVGGLGLGLFVWYGCLKTHGNWRIESRVHDALGSYDYDAAWWHFLIAFLFVGGFAGGVQDTKWLKRTHYGVIVSDGFWALSLSVLVFLVVDLETLTSALLGVGLPLFLVTVLPLSFSLKEYLKEHPLYRRLFVHGRGGSARFGGVYSFLKYDFNEALKGGGAMEAPVYGGRTKFEDDPKLGCRHIGLNSDSMMLTVAAMGGGKSLYSAWNTLLLWRGGALILDPKGEHADMTAAARKKIGDVHFLAPWSDRFERATYNPLEDIDLQHPNAKDDLQNIVQACIPQEAGETANSKHFRENAQTILLGIMAHVLSEFDRGYHNLPSIYDTILTGHPEGGAADPAAFDDLVTQMAVNEAFGRAPMDAAKILNSAGANERGGFLTTLANGLSWANSEAIRPCISKSSFSMKDLRSRRATVYVVIPFENMAANARYMRVIVGAALLACREPLVKAAGQSVAGNTLVLLDEFPQLGTFEPIKEGLVTLRSQKVKIWMMLQDIGQLKERYKNWQDFMSSCDKQFFAVNDDETAEVVQKSLGEYVDREGTIERTKPLRPVGEVREDLRKGSGLQYLMPADGNPMILKLVPAFKNFSAIKRTS